LSFRQNEDGKTEIFTALAPFFALCQSPSDATSKGDQRKKYAFTLTCLGLSNIPPDFGPVDSLSLVQEDGSLSPKQTRKNV
jgi:hypothetical protein